jgi:hypothetical protein
MQAKAVSVLGRVERVSFPHQELKSIPARVDTGAKTSSIWASGITEKNGVLYFKLFNSKSRYFNGKVLHTSDYSQRVVASSNGHAQTRYVVRLLVTVQGRKIRALFTLADRSKQVYPVLIGRNVLRGKFIVDVRQGQPLIEAEKLRTKNLKKSAKIQRS